MTAPFDERLSEKLVEFALKAHGLLDNQTFFDKDGEPQKGTELVDKTIVAIHTLFLDLIAEAKPEYKDGAYYTKHPVLWKPVAPEDSDNNVADAGFNEGLERFENNLIQAIEGGKK
jgi:hypothetical protein